MTTTKLFSKDAKFGPAYLSALKAQFPFAVISGILFLILFIVVFFVSTVNQYDPANAHHFFREYFQQGIYAEMSQSTIALIILALIALASTLVGMSYLHSKKTVDVYHSLPVTRPQLLSANLLATLTAALGPFLAMYLLTMIIQLVTCAGYGCFNAEYFRFIAFDIMSAVVYTAVIAVFTAFMAVNVGTVFDAFSVTMAIGFAPPLIYVIAGTIWQNLVYGALFERGGNWICLSPFMFIFKTYTYIDRYTYTSAERVLYRDYGTASLVLLFGLLAAAALFIAAAACYRRRKSEVAEQTQPRGILQIIVKLIAAFLGGSLFFAIFEDSGITVSRFIAIFIGSVSIGLIAEIILSRGVREVVKNLKWLLIAGVTYCLILVGVQADIFGYASRIPELDSIASVRINYSGRFAVTEQSPYYSRDVLGIALTEPESIAIVREAHSIAMNNRPSQTVDEMLFDYDTIRIEYKLKNGATMSRTYSPVYGGAYQKLAGLENKRDFIRARSTLFWAEQNPQTARVETVELYASIDNRSGRHASVLDDPDALLDAIRADMLEQSLEDITNPSTPALGFIKVNFGQIELKYDSGGYYHALPYSIVTVTREYERTLEVLRRLKLAGDFSGESLRLDEVVKVGMVPTWERDYYGSNRVRSFNPWIMAGDDLPWNPQHEYAKDGSYPYSVFFISADSAVIKAIAEASKDTLFAPGRQDWHNKYAFVYFETTDGSSIVKAVKFDDLPPDIREKAMESYPEVYGEKNETAALEETAA